MASKKFYGYYVKANKIALIEKDVSTSGSDLNAEDYGKYKSPKDSVTNGLELEYTYIPTYSKVETESMSADTSSTGGLYHMFGWGDVDGYLSFYHSDGDASYTDWSSAAYNEEIGTAGTDYILIENSSRWNGLHKVKERNASGWIQTTTRTGIRTTAKFLNGDVVAATRKFDDDGRGEIKLIFPSTSETYYWMMAGSAEDNKGIYEGSSNGVETLTAEVHIYLNAATNEYTDQPIADAGITNETNSTNGVIHRIYRDECKLYGSVAFDMLEDESFDVDLPTYLCKALVYYVKAKDAEDKGEIDLYKYNISEFK